MIYHSTPSWKFCFEINFRKGLLKTFSFFWLESKMSKYWLDLVQVLATPKKVRARLLRLNEYSLSYTRCRQSLEKQICISALYETKEPLELLPLILTTVIVRHFREFMTRSFSIFKAAGSALLRVRYQSLQATNFTFQLPWQWAYAEHALLSVFSRVFSFLQIHPFKAAIDILSLALSISTTLFQAFASTAFSPLSYRV